VSTPHSHDTMTGNTAAATRTQPLVLLRARRGTTVERARVVHLAPLPPSGTGALRALCGALLRLDEHQTVRPGSGMPCSVCLLSHTPPSDTPPAPQGTNPASARTPSPDPTSPDTTPLSATLGYRAWGWPVTLRRGQVGLALGRDLVALLMPTLLAIEVTTLLAPRCCLPAVLVHPYAPEHLVLLCGERYGIALPWPDEVRQINGILLLPPSTTPRGPLHWVHPPRPESIPLCREIDVLAAVRAIQRDPPPPSGPMPF
jgi:hypothetical protein